MPDTHGLIEHISDLPTYAPPAHSGTVNRRLIDGEIGAGFEMILGHIMPGGEASRHHHAAEWQVVYILKGEATVCLGQHEPRRCGPGTVVRIPPGLAHEVVATGDAPLECIVVYAPALGPDGFVAAPRPEAEP